jgi:hypothetical protein
MLAVQPHRWLSRPKGLLIFAFTVVTLYWLLLHGSGGYRNVTQQGSEDIVVNAASESNSDEKMNEEADDPNHVLTFEEKMKEAHEENQEAIRQQFRLEYDQLGR